MSILGPNGKPIASQRKVTIGLTINDQAAGDTKATRHAIGFELDSTDPVKIEEFIGYLTRSLRMKLSELGYQGGHGALGAGVRLATSVGANGLSGGSNVEAR